MTFRRPVTATVLVVLLTALAPPPATASGESVIAFCKANRTRCAISVSAVSERWERHLNPDRPQTLASTMKVLSLIAYSQAVTAGKLAPQTVIPRDSWARFLTLDGGALATSWNDLGQPTTVTADQLATRMILRSDNAFPDWLLSRLGAQAFESARKLFPFHDPPAPISGMFGLWNGANGEGGAGNRLALDYGNFGVAGYQAEVAAYGAQLWSSDAAVTANRRGLCVQPPWLAGPPPCSPTQPGIAPGTYPILRREMFTRSTTRSYLRVMRGLLEGNLLPAATQQVVRRHLESWFGHFPTLGQHWNRYGIKGGSLATSQGLDVLTWAHYMETKAGQRYVVVVFLQALEGVAGAPTAADLNEFAQRFAYDAPFRAKVKAAFAAADARPELLATISEVTRQGTTLTVRGRVDNLSPNATKKPIRVELRLSAAPDRAGDVLVKRLTVPVLAGNKGAAFTLTGPAPGALGQLAIVHVDSANVVAEQDEGDNLTWSRVR